MSAVSRVQMRCRQRASSSSTWGSMSAREEVAAAAQRQPLGSRYVNACRSDGLGRKLLSVTWRHCLAMGARDLSEFADRGGCRSCRRMLAAHMEYGSSQDCQLLIVPKRVILEWIDLHGLATSADMVYWSRLSQQTFLHLLDRSSSRPVDRVQTARQVSVVCRPRAMPDGCDSGSAKAGCHCESRSGFAGVAQRACMCAPELAWAIGGGFARLPWRASGAGCTSYYYDAVWVQKSRGQGAICGSIDGSRMVIAAAGRW